jgi:hypothetical protein
VNDLRAVIRAFLGEHSPEMLVLFRRVRRAAQNHLGSTRRPFERIYRDNLWGCPESVSGYGSSESATAELCKALPALILDLGVRTLVDAPCGDFWIRRANLTLEQYTGVDAVTELVDANNRNHGATGRVFQVMDLIVAAPPRADLLLCRDLLIHLSFRHARRVLSNFKRSRSQYLLCSQNPDWESNEDIVTGNFHPLNLRGFPFEFPAPILELGDNPPTPPPPGHRRTMALWRLSDLPIP